MCVCVCVCGTSVLVLRLVFWISKTFGSDCLKKKKRRRLIQFFRSGAVSFS